MTDVSTWLADLGLAKYAPAFVAHEVDLDALLQLSEADLETLGLPLGPRRKVMAALAARARQAPPPAAPAPRGEAERRQLTVLFVDLVGSTELSASLDPEEMRGVLRAYQDAVAGEIARVGGHLAKLMGDGVLAYFGWPRAHEDEAERAVRAGLALVAAVGRLADPSGTPLSCRVGIATGAVIVGDLIGEGSSQEAAVVGETPNLAARLMAAAGAGEVVIAAATRRLLGSGVVLEELGDLALKGLARPQPAFRVREILAVESRFAARADPTLVPLVGREEELALLQRAWRQARDGDGQAVLILGEAGIGKSRLLRALRDAIDEEEAPTIHCQCSPFHADTPLWPVQQQLTAAAAIEAGDSAATRCAKLQSILTPAVGDLPAAALVLAPLVGVPSDEAALGDVPAAELRGRMLRALGDQLQGRARVAPILMVLEDAHWIDPTTLELLQRIVATMDDQRMLLVVTARPERAPAMNAAPHITRLALSRLGRAAADALIGEVAAARALPEPTRREILARSDGVPLFIEELTKAVLETAPAGQQAVVPATLQESLIARLDRAPGMKAVAQIAACIGRDFDHRLLEVVSDLPPAELATGLRGLIEAELVFDRGVPPDAVYTFKHALVRDTAYQTLLKERRQNVHERIALALEVSGSAADETPELLARHWAAAGEVVRAADHWLAAGKLAARRSANLEAVEHLSQGLELLRQNPTVEDASGRRLSLLIAQGPALMATRGWGAQEAEDAYTEAATLAAATGRSADLFPALWGRWLGAHGGGRADASRSVLAQLFELARETNDTQLVLQAHHAGTSNMLTDGDLHAIRDHAEAVLLLYRPGLHRQQALVYGGHDPAVCVRCISAIGQLMEGRIARAEETSLDGLGFAETVEHLPSLAHAQTYRAEMCHINGNAQETEQRARAVLEIAVPRGMAHYVAWATIALGWCLARRGEHAAALAHMDEGMAALHASKNLYHLPHRLTQRAEILAACGRMREAAEAFEEAVQSIGQTGERWYESEVLRKQAALLESLSPSEAPRVAALLERALEVADRQGARLWKLRTATDLARHWARHDHGRKAAQFLAPICAGFADEPGAADLQRAKAVLAAL